MKTRHCLLFIVTLAMFLIPFQAFAGGAWVPPPGQGAFELGYSRKTASSSWDSAGHAFPNLTTVAGQRVPAYHDFRYAFASGELGIFRRVSVQFVVPYLFGYEGPHGAMERNVGWTDSWYGLKYAVKDGGNWPMAIAATYRTPFLYDLPGAYNRYIYDANGVRRGVSPEWRGVLKHDYTVSYLVSHSFKEGRGWMTFETGYTWRQGAPADQIPFNAEVGWPLKWGGMRLKTTLANVNSVGNDSVARPDDRFRANSTFNFNDASMLKAGVGIVFPARYRVDFELGYNQWLWGKSARRYREPYFSVGHQF